MIQFNGYAAALRRGFFVFVLFPAIIISAALAFVFAAEPSLSVPQHSVLPGVVCPLAAVQADAERLARSTPIAPNPACRPWPVPAAIVAVHSGPFRDADGDAFYIVQVAPFDESGGGGLFTIAWPGFNSDLPVRIGI